MAVTAKFVSDFSDFDRAVKNAELELKSFQTGAANVEKQLNRTADAFSGRKILSEATLAAEAIERIGGTTKLTRAEQDRLNATVTEALAKYKALGMEAPPHLTKLMNETKKVETATGAIPSKLSAITGGASSMASALGIAFSVGAVVNFGKAIVADVSKVHDLAQQLGISTDAVQGFKFAAEQTGSSLDAVGTALQKMNQKLAEGDKGTVGLLKDAGLQFATIRNMKPEDAFLTITDAIKGIEDPMERSRIALGLFGKSAGELLPGMVEGFRELSDGAAKYSKETIERLEKAGDAWEDLSNRATIASGELLGQTLGFVDQATRSWSDFFRMAGSLGARISGLPALGNVMALDPKAKAPVVTTPSAAGRRTGAAEDEAAAKSAAAALKQHAEAVKNLMAAYSGRAAIDAANLSLEAVTAAARAGVPIMRMTRESQDSINKTMGAAIEVYRQQGRVAPDAIRSVYSATLDVTKLIPFVAGLPTNFKDLGVAAAGAIPPLEYLAGIPVGMKIGKEIDVVIPKLGKVHDGLDELGIAFDQLARIGGASFGSLFDGASTLVRAMQTKTLAGGKGTGGILTPMFDKDAVASEKWAAGVQAAGVIASGAMNVWAATANDGTKAAGAFHGSFSGAQAGAAFGPWGAAIGGASGALLGLIHTLSAGRRAVKDFAQSFDTAAAGSGFDELRSKLLILGAEGERLWKKLTQGTKKGDKAGAQRVIDEINAALAQADPINLNEMIRSAQVAGTKIPAALQPVIETLIRTGKLTQENANLMLGLPEKGVPSFDAVKAAAERLGIDIEALGPKVKGIKFSEEAAQMVLDFETVRDAGGEMGVVFDQSAPKVQKLIDNAKQYGVELPLALKPFLEDMVKQGKLTDENGKKLEDLTGINFAEPLEKSIDRLILAMQDLIGTITGGVGGALDTLGNKVVRPTIRPRYDPSDMPDGSTTVDPGPGFAGGTHGKYLDFGAGRRVTLHGKERIMTEEEGRGDVVPFPAGGDSGSRTIVIQTYLNSRMLAEEIVPDIPDVIKRYGLA
jgi:polyhydroxyalkanoate synthesis regulator phasin